jgi:hypothetical protein
MEFAVAVLQGLQIVPVEANVRAMVAWMEAEDTRAMYNPLATTKIKVGNTDARYKEAGGVLNSHNVRNYASFDEGVRATVDTLDGSLYRHVVSALQKGAGATIQDLSTAVGNSRWGTGYFGGRTGDSAVAPLGQSLAGTPTEGDPYANLGAEGGTTGGGVELRENDLDEVIKSLWPEGIPEDVTWADLPQNMQLEVQQDLGFVTTYLEHPELGSLLIRSSLEGWDDALLDNMIENTQWWKDTDIAVRDWEGITITDPGEAERRRESRRASLHDAASKAGVVLSQEDMELIVEESLKFAWTDAQIVDAVVAQHVYDPSGPTPLGDISTFGQNLKEQASTYGLAYSDEVANQYATQIAAGELEEDDLRVLMIDEASGRFPWMADQFEQGYSLNQLMDTRANEVARIMGIDAQEIDFLNDPKWNPILEYNGEDGMRSMNLQETRQYIGQLPDYEKTADANARGSSFARTLLQKFGAI